MATPAGVVLTTRAAELGGVMSLRAYEAEDELMVGFVEAGRVDDVGGLDGVDEISESNTGVLQQRKIGNDVELGNLAALNDYGADSGERD